MLVIKYFKSLFLTFMGQIKRGLFQTVTLCRLLDETSTVKLINVGPVYNHDSGFECHDKFITQGQ